MGEIIRPHNFDALSQYCTKCGIARTKAVDLDQFHCKAGENVAGISHLIAHRRIAAQLEQLNGS